MISRLLCRLNLHRWLPVKSEEIGASLYEVTERYAWCGKARTETRDRWEQMR